MAKRLRQFIDPFRESRIPYLLAEVLTRGDGEMTDLLCRYANGAAGEALDVDAGEITGKRYTHFSRAQRLEELRPIQEVAFSGSAASFPYRTGVGRVYTVTCYQVMYGVAAVILEPRHYAAPDSPHLLAERLPGALMTLELSREGLRCMAFADKLGTMTGWSRRELTLMASEDFSSLVDREDWPDLLQDLMDAARGGRRVGHAFRLLRREGPPLWVELRAEIGDAQGGAATFFALVDAAGSGRRDRERLRLAQEQADAASRRLEDIFTNFPGGFCVFSRGGADEPLVLERMSRGLAELLGYSFQELFGRVAEDPLCRVPAADREGLTEEAAKARREGRSLQRVCRLRNRSGQIFWVSLGVVWQEREGESVLYAACFDVSQERAQASESMLRAKLCELLLDKSRVMSFDYDPLTDTTRAERGSAAGRKTVEVSKEYIAALDDASAIHPEDRERRTAAVRTLMERPGVETVEYRANYDGQGWRWCRVSWLSLFDSKGAFYRLLGKAEDVMWKKASELRFQRLCLKERKLPPEILAAARLDLSADRILDAKGANRHLAQVLFGNTADACLRHLRDNIPDVSQRETFDGVFRREALISSLQSGFWQLSLEHRFTLGETAGSCWARTAVELAEDPENLHMTAFCTVYDIDRQRQREELLEALARRDYDVVLTVNAVTGLCRVYGRAAVPEEIPYRALAARYIAAQVPTRRRAEFRRAARLPSILQQLESQEFFTYVGELDTDQGPQRKRMCWSWLDREAEILLVTLETL